MRLVYSKKQFQDPLHIIITALFLCFTFTGRCCATACDGSNPSASNLSAWEEFNAFELKTTKPGTSDYASYHGEFDQKSSDIQIEVEILEAGKTIKGKILMIGGRVMATQGPITEPGYEIDALDAAVLQQQLAVRLLAEAIPEGPAAVSGKQQINHKSETQGVCFATPSAEGYIPPPWQLTGFIKNAPRGGVQYEMRLVSGTSEKSSKQASAYDLTFNGRLSKVLTARIDDSMSLADWNLFGVGVQTRETKGGTVFDYSSAPATEPYQTVAHVRRKLAQDDYPGEPDLSKNFTGFWKEDCDEPFGLQIKHFGDDGKYSIVFCGPGGCGNPGEDGHSTFINKDRGYEVVSATEIKIRRSDGWDTYHKCTTDTHPVLKYKQQ